MARKFKKIMTKDFFLGAQNLNGMFDLSQNANLELSFALIEENSYEILGYVIMVPKNVGELNIVSLKEDDEEQFEKLKSLSGCQIDIYAENNEIRLQLIKAIPARIQQWNIENDKEIAYYYMDVVANNNVETIKIELDATDSFEYLENMCSKKTIIYCMLNV